MEKVLYCNIKFGEVLFLFLFVMYFSLYLKKINISL